MNLIGKLQPIIIITAALLGLLLGAVTPLGEVSSLDLWTSALVC